MTSLLSLPPEIFNAVIEGLSGSDVVNVRRVCRRTNALSSHQFGLKCLADLSFIWSSYSLQGLLDISRHPLGRYVRRLTFATHFIYAERLTEDPTEQRTARLKNLFEQWEERNELLVQALENLQKLSVQPILGVYDILVPWVPLDNSDNGDRPPRKGYGFERYYGAVGVDSRPPFVHTIEYVLKAAQRANFPIKAFHVHWNKDRRREGDDLRVLREQYLFSAPGKLNPDFELLTTRQGFDQFEDRIVDWTTKTLIDTRNQKLEFSTIQLKGVKLGTHPRSYFDGHILPTGEIDHCFREIRLALLSTEFDLLITFLTSQARTLRVLHLEAIRIPLYDVGGEVAAELNPDHTALNFLSMLKNDLSLEYLRMTRLCDNFDFRRLIGGHDDTWVGREEIQEGLRIYMQREEDDEFSVDEELTDDDEGEWISVHHSEDDDDGETQPGALYDENNEETTQQ